MNQFSTVEIPDDHALLEEAKFTVMRNLLVSGLKERIVANSRHGRGLNFDRVDFFAGFGDPISGGGISVRPALRPAEGESMTTSQPVMLKLFNITEDKVEQQRLADSIWQSVGEANKKAIIREALRQLENSSLLWTGGLGYRKLLDAVREGLDSGGLDMKIEPQYASLKVFVR